MPITSASRLLRQAGVSNLLADRILPGKVLPRQSLVDDDYKRLRCVLRFRKITAARKFGSQCREESGVHLALVYFIMFTVVGLAYDPDPSGVAVKADGQNRGEADRFHSRQARDAVHNLVSHSQNLRIFCVGNLGQLNTDSSEMLRLESDVYMQQPVEAFA